VKILKKDSLFKGTAILSISLILTKVLGAVYLIPFYQIIGGEEQMALFNYGYSYYATILEISAAGVPLAIAKLVAKYNALGAYSISRKIYRLGSWILVVMGIIGFCILFFGSGFISEQILISNQQKFTPQEGALVLKSLSFGIPLVLISAGIRGLFQGHEIMLPSALSQFVEQVARIAFMLGATYFIMRVLGYGVVEGNVSATFAAAVGAVFSLITLSFFYTKYRRSLDFNSPDKTETNVDFPQPISPCKKRRWPSGSSKERLSIITRCSRMICNCLTSRTFIKIYPVFFSHHAAESHELLAPFLFFLL